VGQSPETNPATSLSFAGSRGRRHYLETIRERGIGAFVANAPGAELHIHSIGDDLVPVVRMPGDEPAAALFSPLVRLLAYPFFAIGRESGPIVRSACAVLSQLSCGSLRALGLDRVAYVNHWLNPTAPRLVLAPLDLRRLVEELIDAHSDHALIFDGLTPLFDADLIEQLSALGAISIPGSTSWISNHADSFHGTRGRPIRKTRRADRVRRDALIPSMVTDPNLLRDRGEQLRRLYSKVYLERHPAHLNVQFTAEFFELLVESDFWEVTVWAREGRFVAFNSLLRDSSVVESGPFGLDTDLPRSLGLFRAIISTESEIAEGTGLPLDLGGGNDRFKRLRGFHPHQTYTLVLAGHISAPRRAAWQALARARTAWRTGRQG
jgi:hypothetical protein